MEMFSQLMDRVNGIVWGPGMIVLLVGTGIYLTFRLRFIQIRQFGHAIKCVSGKYDDPKEQGDITHFQALCSALSATVGTGNIAGVATAIALGGPGAIFWMWVTAVVGMATKFTSCSLAIRYRVIHEDGSVSGGPMYFLELGLGLKWLGKCFAFFVALGALGAGCMVQSNSISHGVMMVIPTDWQSGLVLPFFGGTRYAEIAVGLVVAILVGIVTIGGIKRIAHVATAIVPFMCLLYVVAALVILALNFRAVPQAFSDIFYYAFSPLAAGSGFLGAVLARTMQKGVARGVFSNESGLGSAPIAHAAAKTQEMAREGMVAMLGPFIDTLVICTMTALVIITSGIWQVHSDEGELLYGPGGKGLPMRVEIDGKGVQVIGTIDDDPEPYRDRDGNYYLLPTGVGMTAASFEKQLPLPRVGHWLVAIALMFFAYTSMIAWSYYGDRSCEYLLGVRSVNPYRVLFCLVAALGPLGGLDLIWVIADNLNAMMAVPNLIALIGLSTVVSKETKSYIRRMRDGD